MTDSEKLDLILNMVKEIRQAIGYMPGAPQHLWSAERVAEESNRQRIAMGLPYGYDQRAAAGKSEGQK